ncbi:MAG: efflux RND transporter periplasmic adaptor subunit, partial [Nitrosospira sp.]
PPLMPGLFVKAEIEGREQSDVFVLPSVAVNTVREALWIDAEDRLHIRRLEVLRSEPDRVLVKGGLNAGDRVVVSGIDIPVEGMQVRTETITLEQGPEENALGKPTASQTP